MRRALGVVVAPLVLASCAVVLGIEDVPFAPLDAALPAEGGAGSADAPPGSRDGPPDRPPPDAGTGSGDAGDAGGDARVCPRRAPTNTAGLSSCEARVDGNYCGDNTQLNPKTGVYPNKNDLVICGGGQIVEARPCTRCLPMPATMPDECDPCDCLDDGLYCGRDIVGWNAENANMQLRCTAGVASAPKACAACTREAECP